MKMPPKQKQTVSKSVSVLKNYPVLVKTIQSELRALDFFIRNRVAESYWRVGKFIHEYLLDHKGRARYGQRIFKRLAEDVGRDASTLQKMVRFYRAYPVLVDRPELTWSHYRLLMLVKDTDQRAKLEQRTVLNEWDATDLEEYLRKRKRSLALNLLSHSPIPQLKVTRGRMNTFNLVMSMAKGRGLQVDFGFRIHKDFHRKSHTHLGPDDCVAIGPQDTGNFLKATASKDELFTYRSEIVKIIDGDTFWGTIALPFEMTIDQKLRLRGIDCPEIGTAKGKAAKSFVESRLKGLKFIVAKTYKDTADKYDRYLTDIFYLRGETDESKVASEGRYLNQELLDERLATAYE